MTWIAFAILAMFYDIVDKCILKGILHLVTFCDNFMREKIEYWFDSLPSFEQCQKTAILASTIFNDKVDKGILKEILHLVPL